MAQPYGDTGKRAWKRRPLGRRVRMRWQLYVFLILPVAYLVVFHYQPMIGVQIAFRDFLPRQGLWRSEWVGLKHFRALFDSFYFGRVVGNTIRLSLYSLAVSFPLSILFALMLNVVIHPRFKKTVQTIIYAPHFISVVVLVGLILQVFNPVVGLYGNLYRRFIADQYPADFLSRATPFIHLYVWSGVWQNLGWGTIIYLAALSASDPELHEAAQIDGATRLQRVLHIDLPIVLPTASIMLILNAGALMSVGFEKAFLLQNPGNLAYSEIIATYVYKIGLTSSTNQMSYASAVNLLNNAINGILLLMVNALSRRMGDGTGGLW